MSTPITEAQVHDAFFKSIMEDAEIAEQFLHEYLPKAVVELLEPGPPELQPGSFVDESFRRHQTDILFRVRLRGGGEVLPYILVEHKSAPDPLACLQLLRYVARILVRWHRVNKRLPLPVVIPVIVHHGPSPWCYSQQLEGLLGDVAQPLRTYLSLRHELVDLAAIDDAAFHGSVRLRTYLMLMKYIRRRDLAQHLVTVLAHCLALARVDWDRLLNYIDAGAAYLDKDELRAALDRVAPTQAEEIMGFISQPYFEKGIEKGMETGLAKGQIKGLADALMRLLERRFGSVPAPIGERVFAADEAALRSWFDLAIDAPSLEAVFG